jgi:hypothetical protein
MKRGSRLRSAFVNGNAQTCPIVDALPMQRWLSEQENETMSTLRADEAAGEKGLEGIQRRVPD